MVRRAGWWIGSGVLLATLGCSGDEFASQGTGGAGGAVAGGGTGGVAGAGASGGMAGTAGGTGGAAGGPGPGGTGGAGGAAGTGGTGGSWPECGPLAGAPLLLYSTLDSLVAIKTPSKGVPPGSSLPTDDFQSAKCDHGIVIDQANEHVVFVQNQNINFAKGTIDFWYVPFAPETDDKLHHLFATSGYLKPGEGGLKIRKSDDLNANELTVYIKDPAGVTHKTSVPESAYSFVAKTPVRITVAWDLTAPVSSPAVRIFFDTVEAPSYGERALLPIITPIADSNTGVMYVGAENGVDPTPAVGVIDDFKIYGAMLAP